MGSIAVSYDTAANGAVCSMSESDALGLYGSSELQPEKRLMFAVLLDAIECYQDYVGDKNNPLFKNAQGWIFEDDHKSTFSFINICEAVDMNPTYLRKGLLEWNNQRFLSTKGCTINPNHRVP